MRLSDLVQLKKNPNKGSERGNALLETSFEKGGAGRSILIANNGEILAGNHATEVYGQLFDEQDVLVVETDGKQLVAVKRTDIPDSDDERAKALIIGDNRTSDFHEYDTEVIKELLESDKDLLNSFFFENELDELLSSLTPDTLTETEESEPSINRADELQQKWVVQRGDLYQVGKHRIMCGDSTDKNDVARLMDGIEPDFGIHDPPYGISVVNKSIGGSKPFGKSKINKHIKVNNYDSIIGDNEPFDPSHLLSICRNSIIWGANYFSDKLPPKKGWIVWDKKGKEWNDNFSDCELAWTSLPIVTKIYRYLWMGIIQEGERETRLHPTQKPSGLFIELMNDLFTPECSVIDCYLGSGTTIVACEQTNRIGYGMELHPPYVAVCLERLSNLGLDVKKL